jgi:hypothetical protein
MKFEKINLNPKGMKAADCVIRSIAKATNKTWDEVYLDLVAIGFKKKAMPNDKRVFAAYLEQLGFEKHKMPRTDSGLSYQIIEYFSILDIKNQLKGAYVVSIRSHLTCVVDGVLYDTFDCRTSKLLNYWTKK